MQTFFDFTPPKHLTAGVASICGPRVRCSVYDMHSISALSLYKKAKAELSCNEKKKKKEYGRGVCSLRKKKNNIKLTAPIPLLKHIATCSTHILYMHQCIHKQTHTQIQILDVGSQFSKHSPYPLLL